MASGRLKRNIGLVGLTFIAVGGMLGSGWLFAPMLVSQQAGPAAILSWLVGGTMMLLIALTFAEVSSLLPIAGGIARIPHFSHGNVVSMALGFTAWIGYSTNAPIATMVLLQYVAVTFDWVYVGDVDQLRLSPAGFAAAAVIMLVMVLINVVGVRFFAACNTGLTWFKLLVPLIVGGTILAADFDFANLTAQGGFAPFGVQGILAGVSTGGVIFAFIGFRHAIDLAGEARNPQVTVPLALGLSVVVCIAVYSVVQIAFLGALDAEDLANGWDQLTLPHNLGPLAAVASALGLVWLGATIYGGAIIGPFGDALVSTGSNARLTLALSRNGFLFPFFDFLSENGVPLRALVLNYALGIAFLLLMSFSDLVTLNISTIVLSLTVGPVAVATLRKQLIGHVRGFTLPFVEIAAPAAFACSVLILYWAGWKTMGHLAMALVLGCALFGLRAITDRQLFRDLELVHAGWLFCLLPGVWLISYLGNFGGGLGILPFGWDLLACTALALGVFALAVRWRLPAEKANRRVAHALADHAGPPHPAAAAAIRDGSGSPGPASS
ncbi:MAG: APC family permease [Pseudomonadota bacterium]